MCAVAVYHRSFFSTLLTLSRMEMMLAFLVEKLMVDDELGVIRLVPH